MVIGSVARGDVTESSDVDVHLKTYVPSYLVAACLLERGIEITRYEITQATPDTAVRINVVIDERTSISIPASRLSKSEEEFPRFAGFLTLRDLLADKRVPGVNKQLLLIVPTEYGHIERSIIGYENEVAQFLGVSLETVRERVQMRTRRAVQARAGFFVHRVVPPDSQPEQVLLDLASRIPQLRRKLEGTLF